METHPVRFPFVLMVPPAAMCIRGWSGVVATPSTPAFTVMIVTTLILVINVAVDNTCKSIYNEYIPWEINYDLVFILGIFSRIHSGCIPHGIPFQYGFQDNHRMNMEKETIYHLTCKVCRGWFSVATMESWMPTKLYCPHCGIKDDITVLTMHAINHTGVKNE